MNLSIHKLSIHQTTSLAAGYRRSLEGYSRAGIRHVEIIGPHVDPFIASDGLAAAKRLLADLGLTAVSHGGMVGLWDPGPDDSPARTKALEDLQHHAEVAASMGIDRMVCPCIANGQFTAEDYRTVVDRMRSAGDIARQFGVTLMVEFTRASNFIGTLPTTLRLVREAAHPNIRPLFDFYHFWAGLSKFEDLELIQSGEIPHVHIQDVPDMPRERLDNTTREIPGTGVAPIARILERLTAKGYSGPVSVELFYPKFQEADPYELARTIREHTEPFLS